MVPLQYIRGSVHPKIKKLYQKMFSYVSIHHHTQFVTVSLIQLTNKPTNKQANKRTGAETEPPWHRSILINNNDDPSQLFSLTIYKLRTSLMDIWGPFSLVNALRCIGPGGKQTLLFAFSPEQQKTVGWNSLWSTGLLLVSHKHYTYITSVIIIMNDPDVNKLIFLN